MQLTTYGMYDLIEYSGKYSKKSGSLWQYSGPSTNYQLWCPKKVPDSLISVIAQIICCQQEVKDKSDL